MKRLWIDYSCVLYVIIYSSIITRTSSTSCSAEIVVLVNNANTAQGVAVVSAANFAGTIWQSLENVTCDISTRIISTYGQPNLTVTALLMHPNNSGIVGVDPGCPECCVHAATFAAAQSKLSTAGNTFNRGELLR